jgi:hypothetical protein
MADDFPEQNERRINQVLLTENQVLRAAISRIQAIAKKNGTISAICFEALREAAQVRVRGPRPREEIRI